MTDECVEIGICKQYTTPVAAQYKMGREDPKHCLVDHHGQYTFKTLTKSEINDYLSNI